VLASVAQLVGHKLPDDAAEDSFSLLPALLGTSPAGPVREAIVHHSSDGTFAIREGRWKLAMKLGSHGFSDPKSVEPEPGGPRGQLYDLAVDPRESRNRWLAEPAVVERLTSLLTHHQQQGRSRPGE
jgi:hypothetical protein